MIDMGKILDEIKDSYAKKKRKTEKLIGKSIPTSKRGVPLTRCSHTLTESQFFSRIRSHARRMSLKWKPRTDYLQSVRRPYTGASKKTKWEYPCMNCKKWAVLTQMEVDHIIPCGSLRSFEDIGPFFERMLCEMDGFIIYCKKCHLEKTLRDRAGE